MVAREDLAVHPSLPDERAEVLEIMMKKAQGLWTTAQHDQEGLRQRIEHAQELQVTESQGQRMLGPITPRAVTR